MMKKDNYSVQLKELVDDLKKSAGILLDTAELNQETDEANLMPGLPAAVSDFYKEINGFTLEWHVKENKSEAVLRGLCRLLSVEEMNMPTDGIVVFSSTPPDDPIRKFVIVDFFVDEACVGFYREGGDQSLYFYDFEDVPRSLYLDMEGYVKMLMAARGFWYWQLVLLDLNDGDEHTETTHFKQFMPQVFPRFSFEEFEKLYQSLKLK